MGDDWLRWVLGGLVAFYTAITSWLVVTLFTADRRNIQMHALLDKRITVLETRPYIDPIQYTKDITRLVEVVSNLTLRVTEDIANRHTEYEEMRKDHLELKRLVERLMQNIHLMETGESS